MFGSLAILENHVNFINGFEIGSINAQVHAILKNGPPIFLLRNTISIGFGECGVVVELFLKKR
jgi:hypothetical protein